MKEGSFQGNGSAAAETAARQSGEELPEAIRGRSVDAREGWLRLESAFIIELIKARGLAGEVPVEWRWRWSKRGHMDTGGRGQKCLLVDNHGQVWDWHILNGLWIRRKEGAHGVA